MRIEMIPLERVVIDGVSVAFGMDRALVVAAIGCGEQVGGRSYYYDSEMAIDYDEDGRVDFIEFLGGIDGSLHPDIFGVSAFDTPADDLAGLLAEKNGGEVDDTEAEYAYQYLELSVGVHRETTPGDVAEMIEEMKADGISTEDNADVRAECRRAAHWATIGVGTAGYYRR